MSAFSPKAGWAVFYERGGMQVATVRLTVGGRAMTTLMYRRPDGVTEQYLLW